jgi:hypothetical protein
MFLLPDKRKRAETFEFPSAKAEPVFKEAR